jgi:bifunctional non-homologous end joining protein LigD
MAKTTPEQIPHVVAPMLATSSAPFDDAGCVFQVKWDGVRALASVIKGAWRLWGRELVDYTDRYPELAVLRKLPVGTVLDGELVAIRGGRPDFHALMRRHSRRIGPAPFFAEPVQYVVFDLLYYRGQCLMDRPLVERRAMLHERFPELPNVSLCEDAIGTGKKFFEVAIEAGHEGVVAKRLSSRYLPDRRGAAWKKIKQKFDLPCVVIGYKTRGAEVSAVLVASLVDGKPRYVGTVELGIPGDLLRRLEGLRISSAAVPCSSPAKWVRPEIFCTVRFCGWRPSGAWRDAAVLSWE